MQGRDRPDRGLICVDGQVAGSFDRSVGAEFANAILSRHQIPYAVLSRALSLWPPDSYPPRLEPAGEIGLERLAKHKVLELADQQCWRLVLVRTLAPRPLFLDKDCARCEPVNAKASRRCCGP